MSKIALVIGHRSGAKGAYGNMGIPEFDFNTKLVDELLKKLESENLGNKYQVFYRSNTISGYTDQMLDLHKRIDAWGASISISFHFNDYSDETVNGHEILYCSDRGHDIAVQLDELFDAYLDNNDRNLKKVKLNPYPIPDDNGAGFCCRGKSVCILIEPFFASFQNRFVCGGDMREPLKQSLVDFIAGL